MIVNFSRILQGLPNGDAPPSSSHSGSTTLFQIQVNFDIPIIEGQIDAYIIDKWLNLREGYFSIHDFSSWEKISYALLKVDPHVKD